MNNKSFGIISGGFYDCMYDESDYQFGGKYYDFDDYMFEDYNPAAIHQFSHGRMLVENGVFNGVRVYISDDEIDSMMLDNFLVFNSEGCLITDEHIKASGYDYSREFCSLSVLSLLNAAFDSGWDTTGYSISSDYAKIELDLNTYFEKLYNSKYSAVQFDKYGGLSLYDEEGNKTITRDCDELKNMICATRAYIDYSLMNVDRQMAVDRKLSTIRPTDMDVIEYIKTVFFIDLKEYAQFVPSNIDSSQWNSIVEDHFASFVATGDKLIREYVHALYSHKFKTFEDYDRFLSDAMSYKNIAFVCLKSGLSAFLYTDDFYAGCSSITYSDYFKFVIGLIGEKENRLSYVVNFVLSNLNFGVYYTLENKLPQCLLIDKLFKNLKYRRVKIWFDGDHLSLFKNGLNLSYWVKFAKYEMYDPRDFKIDGDDNKFVNVVEDFNRIYNPAVFLDGFEKWNGEKFDLLEKQFEPFRVYFMQGLKRKQTFNKINCSVYQPKFHDCGSYLNKLYKAMEVETDGQSTSFYFNNSVIDGSEHSRNLVGMHYLVFQWEQIQNQIEPNEEEVKSFNWLVRSFLVDRITWDFVKISGEDEESESWNVKIFCKMKEKSYSLSALCCPSKVKGMRKLFSYLIVWSQRDGDCFGQCASSKSNNSL